MVTFKSYSTSFVRNKYNKESDRFALNEEQLKEVLSYKDISEKFEYCDWYGNSTSIVATITSVEQDEWNDILFHIETNKSIPKHYVPSPFEILEGKGLLMPIGCSRI